MSSILRRALNVARSNLSDLAERAVSLGRSKSLEEMSDRELERELERRRKARSSQAHREPEPAVAPERPKKAGPAGGGEVDLSDLPIAARQKVRQYYANLELPYGSSLEEVKHAYRRLMRKYHPDRHTDDPARHRLATDLSQKLTVAYNELLMILRGRG